MSNVPAAVWLAGGAATLYALRAAWLGPDPGRCDAATAERWNRRLRLYALGISAVEWATIVRLLATDTPTHELLPVVAPGQADSPGARQLVAALLASFAVPRLISVARADSGLRRFLALQFVSGLPMFCAMIVESQQSGLGLGAWVAMTVVLSPLGLE